MATPQLPLPYASTESAFDLLKPVSCLNLSSLSVVFMPTLTCNCSCSHCFEKHDNNCSADEHWDKLFLGMRALAEATGRRRLRVYWQGGEVLCMTPDSLRRGFSAQDAAFHGGKVTVTNHLQSNLLLYDSRKWKTLVLGRFGGAIGSSLDFPNCYRQTPALLPGEFNGYWLSRKKQAEEDGITVSVISIPNPETLRVGARRFMQFLRDELRVPSVQINFPFPGENRRFEPLDLDHLSEFMEELYRMWVESGRGIDLSPFTNLENKIFRNTGRLPCIWSYSCAAEFMGVGPSGEVAGCDCWVTAFEGQRYGSVLDRPASVLESSVRRSMLNRPLVLVRQSRCGGCRFWMICHGGCATRAYAFSGSIATPDHYCRVYITMFKAVVRELGRS